MEYDIGIERGAEIKLFARVSEGDGLATRDLPATDDQSTLRDRCRQQVAPNVNTQKIETHNLAVGARALNAARARDGT